MHAFGSSSQYGWHEKKKGIDRKDMMDDQTDQMNGTKRYMP